MRLRNNLVLIFAFLASTASSRGFGGSRGKGVITFESGATITTTQYGEILTLPDTFDVSYPAFNITRLLELHATNETIPQLPGIPPPSNTPASAMLPKGVAHCETSGGSPNQMDVYVISSKLDHLPDNQWCCTGPSKCTIMMYWFTAGSDICNWKSHNKCIHCDAASAGLYLIANKCAKNGKAGGFVR